MSRVLYVAHTSSPGVNACVGLPQDWYGRVMQKNEPVSEISNLTSWSTSMGFTIHDMWARLWGFLLTCVYRECVCTMQTGVCVCMDVCVREIVCAHFHLCVREYYPLCSQFDFTFFEQRSENPRAQQFATQRAFCVVQNTQKRQSFLWLARSQHCCI